MQMPLAPHVPLEVVLAGVDTDALMAMFRQPMLVRARVFGPLGHEPCLQQAEASAAALVADVERIILATGAPLALVGAILAVPPQASHELDLAHETFP